jgi:uncharacterized membrane protein
MLLLLGLQASIAGFTAPMGLLIATVIASCIPICAVSLRAGQGGALLKVSASELPAAEASADGAGGDATGDADASDDGFWAWGLFYHNPNDPSYFVGNRFGVNIGFNYARLPVKIGVAAAAAALALSYIWLTNLFVSML